MDGSRSTGRFFSAVPMENNMQEQHHGLIGRVAGAAAGIVACSLFAAVLGGCTPEGRIPTAQTDGQLINVIAQSPRPVLVDFYKDNCPTCVVQEAELEPLLDEYAGKVTFVRFKIREATMAEVSRRIMDRYQLFWVPTTILFVNGREKQRWVFNHPASEFRAALTPLVGRPAMASTKYNPAWPTASARPAPTTPAPTMSRTNSLWGGSAWSGASGSSASSAGQCTGAGCPLRPEPEGEKKVISPSQFVP